MELPKRTRTYQNHHLDSTRWDLVEPRPDDIVVTTSYKSGTTWTQSILLHLIYADVDPLPESPEGDEGLLKSVAHAEAHEGSRGDEPKTSGGVGGSHTTAEGG